MKYFFSLLVLLLLCNNVIANEDENFVTMFGKEEYGFEQPRYALKERGGTVYDAKTIRALASNEAFPFSSIEQGSVFVSVLNTMAKKARVYLKLVYEEEFYKEERAAFERGGNYVNALFGVPKEYYPYSKNEYIYPAFFENKLHVVTVRDGGVVINTKDDLLKYKGVYIEKDNLSSFIVKELSNYNMTLVKDYNEAFQMIFTRKADYIVAGFYPSQIEAYKLGLRDFVSYSKEAIWKNPLFIRIHYNLLNNPEIEYLKRYLRTDEFKNARDLALDEVLEIYKKNTQGVIPPMYIGNRADEEISAENIQ